MRNYFMVFFNDVATDGDDSSMSDLFTTEYKALQYVKRDIKEWKSKHNVISSKRAVKSSNGDISVKLLWRDRLFGEYTVKSLDVIE